MASIQETDALGAADTVAALDAPDAPGLRLLCDSYGRQMDYARISLTDRCNFRCMYCMPRRGVASVSHGELLRYEELLRLCSILARLGVSFFKITGGEPFCRKGAVPFIKQLTALSGVTEVTITTNGSIVAEHLESIAAAGVRAVTFSLDAISPATFTRIARTTTPLGVVLSAMDRAAALGLRVKINTVPIAGVNDKELVPLARYALERGYMIRFIELMPIGQGKALAGIALDDLFLQMNQAFGPLVKLERKTGNGPAVVYEAGASGGLIGFIAALSGRFCDSCNRLRLLSTGFVKTCLCHEAGVDMRAPLRAGATDAELALLVRHAVKHKLQGHTFLSASAEQSVFDMNSVGG